MPCSSQLPTNGKYMKKQDEVIRFGLSSVFSVENRSLPCALVSSVLLTGGPVLLGRVGCVEIAFI
jgi:hypothetical protein